jgi:FtsP/CotA-like multicopper oxidase with cupredoxin domain
MRRVSKRLLGRIASVAAVVLLVAVLGFVAKAWNDSRLPGTYSVMSFGTHDFGGGSETANHEGHGGAAGISVADLQGPGGGPDAHFELTAKSADIELASGRTIHALTFNGVSPGPELRVRQGDLVQVVLKNEDVEQGVTIHWHGIDLPNGEDGVAGVTQDAVLPGERYTYRFRADQVGTFWYHTHQVASEDVERGLFGAIVIEPRKKPTRVFDRVLIAHTFDGIATLDGRETPSSARVPPGQVRLRLINSDSAMRRFTVSGTSFRVLAIDGHDLNGPGLLDRVRLPLAAGGRYDIGFAMPAGGVTIGLDETGVSLQLSLGRGNAPPPESTQTADFDPLDYGQPAQTPFSRSSRFDRTFELTITKKLGFFDGRPGRHWALNGGIYPDVPMFFVERGDLVHVTVANHTNVVHPMHLHGHHALVLSRNGQPSTGSPWWTDTLDVDPGDEYEIAFRADNPGIWMDHCHNLGHAAAGLTMHVVYEGISTPYLVGGEHDNAPE